MKVGEDIQGVALNSPRRMLATAPHYLKPDLRSDVQRQRLPLGRCSFSCGVGAPKNFGTMESGDLTWNRNQIR